MSTPINSKENAKGQWEYIFDQLGYPWSKKTHAECPLCGKKNFRVDDRNGHGDWVCNCDAGQGFKLVMLAEKVEFLEAVKIVDKILGFDFHAQGGDRLKKEMSSTYSKRVDWVKSLWEKGSPLTGTPGEKYLQSRKIYNKPRGLRFIDSFTYDKEKGLKSHAILSVVTSSSAIVKIHCTFIDGNGKKIDCEANKKIINVWDSEYIEPSSAVKMFNHNGILGVSEGMENSASTMALYDIPSWSAMNAGGLEAFRAPDGVKTLYVFGDNDRHGRGHKAAFTCGYQNLMANNDVEEVFVRLPLIENDFNDILVGGDPRWWQVPLVK